jgi:hypothetical protein
MNNFSIPKNIKEINPFLFIVIFFIVIIISSKVLPYIFSFFLFLSVYIGAPILFFRAMKKEKKSIGVDADIIIGRYKSGLNLDLENIVDKSIYLRISHIMCGFNDKEVIIFTFNRSNNILKKFSRYHIIKKIPLDNVDIIITKKKKFFLTSYETQFIYIDENNVEENILFDSMQNSEKNITTFFNKYYKTITIN